MSTAPNTAFLEAIASNRAELFEPRPPAHTISHRLIYWRRDGTCNGWACWDANYEKTIALVVLTWLERYGITRHHFERGAEDDLVLVADKWIK